MYMSMTGSCTPDSKHVQYHHPNPHTFLSVSEAPPIQELSRAVGVPNVHPLVAELPPVGPPSDKPQQLLCHSPPEHTLRRQQGKLVAQVEPTGVKK